MRACKDTSDLLSAHLDRELPEEVALSVRVHLEVCDACRQELEGIRRTRDALAEVFRRERDAAPPPRDAVDAIADRRTGVSSGRGRIRTQRWLAGAAAAAAIVAACVFFFRQERVIASPTVLLERAANRCLDRKSVEFLVTVDSPALRALARAPRNGAKSGSSFPKYYRLMIASPRNFLLLELDGAGGSWNDALQASGCDGTSTWDYDPERRAVRLGSARDLVGDLGERDVMDFLSWDVMREFADRERKHRVTEETGPSDRRAGRRVLRVEPVERTGAGWTVVHVTIDARTDRIERMVFDALLLGVPFIKIDADIEALDPPLEQDAFRYSAHLPPDIPVIKESTGFPDGAKE